MTKKEKELLKKVICEMLPYGVKGKIETTDGNGKEIKDDGVLNSIFINEFGKTYICIEDMEYELDNFKLYLRPMSSMTAKEKRKFDDFCVIDEFAWNGNTEIGHKNQAVIMSDGIDWLNAHYFDYRGLIEMGLALEAPEGMYKS